ncbi:hypothetical protein PoB_003345900 [Plakobranchus ocellatus]|uniref:Uncharacterized protein n=1 Tax=Plakobranchus ocellatus TaxID=259542 RepID=A0AAV4AKP6_9GAST|nr:hypothetical protein PoB_003345900 [Plakobranchus ocellatus]
MIFTSTKPTNAQGYFYVTKKYAHTGELRTSTPRTMPRLRYWLVLRTMQAIDNLEILVGTENDACTRDLRRLRERCIHKRSSTAPRTMHAQVSFNGSENDACTRELRQHGVRRVHKRTLTVPRTINMLECFDGC